MSLLSSIESKFLDLDNKLTSVKKTLLSRYEHIESNIKKNASEKTKQFDSSLNKTRLELIDKANQSRDSLLDVCRSFDVNQGSFAMIKSLIFESHKNSLIFAKSRIMFSELFIGVLKFRNDFDVVRKFKYVDLFDPSEVVEIKSDLGMGEGEFEDVWNGIIPIERNLIFYYKRVDDLLPYVYLKIANKEGRMLNDMIVDKDYSKFYLEFNCFGNHIIGVFTNYVESVTEIYLFNRYLTTLRVDRVNDDAIEFKSMNFKEIFLWSHKTKCALIYNYELELTRRLDMSSSDFYLEKCFGFDDLKFLGLGANMLKVIFRNSWAKLELDDFDSDSMTIRMDSKSNLIYYSMDRIRCFDSEGKTLLFEKLTKRKRLPFDKFSLTHLDDFYRIDRFRFIYFF